MRNSVGYCGLMLLLVAYGLLPAIVEAQVSCPGVPTYTVDFTGNPTGTFNTPNVSRAGNCCGTISPDRCLHFDITFDTLTAAVNFQVLSGSLSPGSLFYQLDCGAQTQVGSPLCISGGLHHDLTFCKPGNNVNTYSVTSIPFPIFPKNDTVRVGCSKNITVIGLQDSTTTWNSIYPDAAGAYNSYLSCTSNCHTALFTPLVGSPSYIDYQICGIPQVTGCGHNGDTCNTVRIYVYPQLSVTVSPNPASYCPSASGVGLNSTVSGGFGSYSYVWKNSGGSTVGISANYFASSAGTYSLTVIDQLNACPNFTVSIPVNAANVTASIGAINVNCGGGSNGTLTVSATGGSLPYSYQWSNNATTSSLSGMGAGTYSVTVSDAGGCTSNASVTLTQPASLNVTVDSSFNVSCNGNKNGRIYTSASGGVSAYNFLWSPGGYTTNNISKLDAGTYSLTVTDANNCMVTAAVTITQPSFIVPLVGTLGSATALNCFNDSSGTATVNPLTGGTSPFSYLWSNGATTISVSGLLPGPIAVVVSDANGCTTDTTFNITEPNPITSSFPGFSSYLGGYNVSCPGASDGSLNFSVDGGGTPPYTFSWNNGAYTTEDLTNVPAGVYLVTVTDAHGCTHNDSTFLTEPPPINPTITSPLYAGGYNIACKGEASGKIFTTVTGGTPSYSLDWAGPNGFTGTDSDMVKLYAGLYSLTVTDANGCTQNDTITLTEPPTIVPLITKATINGVNIRCYNGNDGLAWVDTVYGGTAPFSFTWDNSVNNDSLANAVVGTHTLHITDDNGCVLDTSIDLNQPDPVISQLSTSGYGGFEVSCHGASDGFIAVDTVIGGVAPYTYLWSTGSTGSQISNLPAQLYSLAITDANGCQDSFPVSISEPDAITLLGSTTDVACNGGSTGGIDVTVFGGTGGPYYLWSPTGDVTSSETNLTAGAYCVHVTDDNGCVYDTCYTLNEPSLLAITSISSPTYAGGTNISCNGGTNGNIFSTENGGVSPYTYYWSNGDTTQNTMNVSVTTYYLTVTDANGCATTDSITLDEPALVATSILSQTDVACYGDSSGSITYSSNGGLAPYTYSLDGINFTPDTFFNGLSLGTYTLSTMDANGCTGSTLVTINQPPGSLHAQADSQTNVGCYGGSTGSVDVSAVNGVPPYQYSIDGVTFQGNGTFSNLSGGNYTVTVKDSNGCAFLVPVTITQPSQVLSASLSATQVSCFGGTNGVATALVSGGTTSYTYSWSASGETTSSATGLAANTYTCTITDANNCSTTASEAITEPPLLTVASSHTNALCNGDFNGTVTISVSGGVSGYFFDWSPLVSNDSTATGLQAGTYICTITDANNCTTQASETVSEASPLTAVSSQTNVACNGGNTGTAQVTVSGGTAGYLYSWSSSAGTSSSVSGLAAGIYMYSVTDANGCTTTSTITITEPTALTATYSKADAFCNGSAGSAMVNVSGGIGGYTYRWSPSGGTDSTASALPANTYTCLVTDGNSCSTAVTITISTASSITPSSVHTDVTCNGGNNGTATVTAAGGTSGYSYNWSSSAGTDSIATGLIANTYTCTITDINGCTAITSVTISEPSALSVSSTPSASILCNGGTTTLTVSGAGGTIPYNGTGAFTLSAGAYSFIITDANGCTVTTSGTMTEPSILSVSSNAGNISCNGGTATINLSGAGGTPPYNGTGSFTVNAGGYSYTITDANGCTAVTSGTVTEPSPLLAAASTTTAIACNGGIGMVSVSASGGTVSYNGTGNFAVIAGTYSYIITDGNGCTASATTAVSQPSALTGTITSNSTSCLGVSNGSAMVSVTGGTSPYTYNWSPGGSTNATASGLAAGSYICLINDFNNCTDSVNVMIIPSQLFAVSAGADQSICGATATLSTSLYSGQSGMWNILTGTGSFADNINPHTQVSGLTYGINTISWNVTDSNGCKATDTLVIESYEPVTADAGPDSIICTMEFTGKYQLQAANPSPGTGVWSKIEGNGTFSDTNSSLCYYNAPVSSGTNIIVWTVTNGVCNASDTVIVRVKDEGRCIDLELPTGFSPNGDGHNDDFFIPGIELYPNNTFVVFSRWGNEVFKRDNYANSYGHNWEGQNKDGAPLPDGTYYVILVVHPGGQTTNGFDKPEIVKNTYVDMRR